MPVVCGQLDITKISEDNLIAVSGYGAWVRFDVDEKIYEIAGYPYGYVVIKFDAPCWTTACPEDTTSEILNAFLMVSTSLNNSILKSGIENADGSSNADLPGSGLPSQLVCGIDVELLKEVQKTVDALQTNEKGFQPAAIRPNACVIPMKSNVFSYGPWASTNFATTYGGAEITVNNDLSPWLFGSISSMNIAGQELANTSLVGLSAAEKGSVTVLGLPAYSIGSALTAGPNLTNISTTFGSAGCTTSYEFSTFTPKFGQVSRAIIEKYKNIVKIRNEQLRYLRQTAIINNKVQIKRFLNMPNNRNGELSKSISDKNSMSRVLVGEIFDYQETLNNDIGQRTILGMTTLSKSVLEMIGSGYLQKGFMSLDGMYGPVSISGDGDLPRFIRLANYTGSPSGISWSVSPEPPIIKNATDVSILIDSEAENNNINEHLEIISIHKDYLNPLANPNSIPYHDGDSAGHCIDMVGRETGVNNSGLITNFYRPEDSGKYSEDYRFIGMRGPLVLHSWGYDTDGKPVPNAADNEEHAKSGEFVTENLRGEFLQDWLQKPKTWPVAPIDLRLDRERGVWVSPQPPKIVTIQLKEDLVSFSDAKGVLINQYDGRSYGKNYLDKDGVVLEDNQMNIIVTDRLGRTATSGTKSYAYFDTYSSKYLLLGGVGSTDLKFAIAHGPWAINTPKQIVAAKWDSAINEWVIAVEPNTNISEIIYAFNGITNINRTDEYLVVLTKIDNTYIYINGGSC